MSDPTRWDERYEKGDTPWETGQPSSELRRVLAEVAIRPCRALELGCGTGASAVWLARQGFDVTALDLSPRAIERARRRAEGAGVRIRFLVADVLDPPAEPAGPFDFFFDRGCYHVVRREDPAGYGETLRRLTRPGALGLVLAGNAREPHQPGPPTVSEEQLREDFGRLFDVVRLREFRFDQVEADGTRFLGWSCLLRRRAEGARSTGPSTSAIFSTTFLNHSPIICTLRDFLTLGQRKSPEKPGVPSNNGPFDGCSKPAQKAANPRNPVKRRGSMLEKIAQSATIITPSEFFLAHQRSGAGQSRRAALTRPPWGGPA
jgi:SAM-dependent methyltransferase